MEEDDRLLEESMLRLKPKVKNCSISVGDSASVNGTGAGIMHHWFTKPPPPSPPTTSENPIKWFEIRP